MASSKTYREVVGMSIRIHSDGSRLIHAFPISDDKGKLSTEESLEGANLQTVIKKFGTSSPYALTIYGHGVLDKKVVNLVPGESNISNKAIPGLSLADYITSEIVGDQEGWVSLAKKDAVENLLEEIQQAGIYVISLSLGYTAAGNLVRLANLEGQLVVNGNALTVNNNWIQSIAVSTLPAQNIKLEDQEISSSFLLAYASGLNYFIQEDISKESVAHIQENITSYGYSKRIKQVLQVGLGILLILGLANAYFFNEAYSTNEKLAIQVNAQRPLLEKVSELKAQKDQLEQAIGSLGDRTQQAYYIDQLGASISGAAITIESLDIYPLTADRKQIGAGDFEFDMASIAITGVSKNPKLFGEWVNQLREVEWVESVEISPFKRNVDGDNEFVVRVGVWA